MALTDHPHILVVLFFMVFVGSQAAVGPEDYWKTMFPNTRMPNEFKELIPDASGQEKTVHIATNESNNDVVESRYFLENDLRPGNKMIVQFSPDANFKGVLRPRSDVDSIPFSLDSFNEILNRLSVDPNSDKAEAMKNTLYYCKVMDTSDKKTCANSLEAMVDFVISKMGKNVKTISTTAPKENSMKEYTIVKVQKVHDHGEIVPCHLKDYAYATFYCHTAKPTVAYEAEMVAADGSMVEAAATCHQDTSKWDRWNLAFKVLKVKPGESSVCHFVAPRDVVWVNNN